jgi:two-component system, chemotaxis family, protein-glutamate methylesterase/glutaminase
MSAPDRAVVHGDAALTRSEKLRVAVVDDSAVVRTMLAKWIAAESDLEFVAAFASGVEAVANVPRLAPDVLILDITMPDLDGLAALPLLLERQPDLVVIMASTLTHHNAEISLRALEQGAADYLPKPGGPDSPSVEVFHRDLIEKVRTLGLAHRPRSVASAPSLAPDNVRVRLHARSQPFVLRGFSPIVPRVLAIGASTGGPQTLTALIANLGALIDHVPVLVTQHMPPTFTTVFADFLARASGRPAREARDGEPVVAGRIYVAPGARHMTVRRDGGRPLIAIDDGPPVNFCKPAVDPLFSSAAQVWGPAALGLVLTGMGSDGLAGATDIVRAGGNIIGQDEATSVVWGMPGGVAHAGLCSAVLPLEAIAPRLIGLFQGAVMPPI